MLSKIQYKLLGIFSKIPLAKNIIYGRASMQMIVFICIVYCLLLGLFVYGWCWQWKYRGILDLPMLLNAIKEMSAPAVLAALQYFIGSLKDANNNGIPDNMEEGEK